MFYFFFYYNKLHKVSKEKGHTENNIQEKKQLFLYSRLSASLADYCAEMKEKED